MYEIQKHLFRYLIAAVTFTLSFGTIFYHYIEHWDWVDAYYFSVVTLTTVGYGDLAPKTDTGKIFTTFYILVGAGIITTFITALLHRWKVRIEHRRDRQLG